MLLKLSCQLEISIQIYEPTGVHYHSNHYRGYTQEMSEGKTYFIMSPAASFIFPVDLDFGITNSIELKLELNYWFS